MKKSFLCFIGILVLLSVLISLGSCSVTKTEYKTVEQVLNSLPEEDRDISLYNTEKYMSPYWDGEVMYAESVYPLENENGTVSPVSLLFKADMILSVRDSSLNTLYEYGTDYVLEDGKLVILPDGNIPTVPYTDYYPAEKTEQSIEKTGGGYIKFGEGDTFHKDQLAVTYIHVKNDLTPPEYKGNLLPKTLEKLNNREMLNVVFYGDSISTGANSSSFISQEPFAGSWYSMTVNELQSRYHSIIMTYNTSVGGTASQWGGLNTSTVTGKKPDLVFIGFGMNDGTLRVSKEKYKRNIESIISKIRQKCPDCEFVLISTMLPNEEAQGFYGEQENYLSVLNELECEGVVVADITSIHKEFLTKKRYCDMTGNNVNHPNDFLSRLYAQVMIQTICDK